MKVLIFLLSVIAIASLAHGQEISFRIETGLLKDAAGDTLTIADSVFVYGGTFGGTYSPAQLEDAIDLLRQDVPSDPSAAAAKLQSLVNEFAVWGQIAVSSKEPPLGQNFDWISTVGGTPGAKFYMLILTDAIDAVSPSTQVGIVSVVDVTVPALSALAVGFETALPNRWNEFYMGSAGSLTLEAIPEPRAYAALFGVCVLALAVIRRRRQRG